MDDEESGNDVFQCAYCGRLYPLEHSAREFTWHWDSKVNEGRDNRYLVVVTCGISCANKISTTFKLGA